MGTYYYAAAALPMLSLQEAPRFSREEFLEFCEEQLSEKDYTLLEQTLLQPGPDSTAGNQILKTWVEWETALRNEIVQVRAAATGRDPQTYIKENREIVGLAEAVKSGLAVSNPLEAEKKLYELRWSFLEELEVNRFFTIESIMIYYLKFQLLEKLHRFDQEAGRENFEKMYEMIRDNAGQEEDIESNSGENP